MLSNQLTSPARGMPKPPLRSGFATPAGGVRCAMRRLLLAIAFLASATLEAQDTDPSTWKPGQVLSEVSIDIVNGYREVEREEVNPEGHWEGVGHFVFVYYKEKRVCQCSAEEIAISPSGEFAIYTDVKDGNLMLFIAHSFATRSLSKEYLGYPYEADWNLDQKYAVVRLKKWVSGKRDYEPVEVKIDL